MQIKNIHKVSKVYFVFMFNLFFTTATSVDTSTDNVHSKCLCVWLTNTSKLPYLED